MKKKLSKKTKILSIVIPLYFLLGIVNINIALLAMLCYIFAFFIMLKTKSKRYCHKYCIRKNTFDVTGNLKKMKKTPKNIFLWKKVFFYYFLVSMSYVIVSTVLVAIGTLSPVEKVKFLILIPVPFTQIFDNLIKLPPVLLHLAYRFYSMLLTTFIIGLMLSIIYKSRTWCAICPYGTVAEKYSGIFKKQKTNEKRQK